MRLRRRYLPLVALLGVATAAVPGLVTGAAQGVAPSTASFVASDSAGGYYGEGHHWYASGGGSSTQVTVAQGATVMFFYPEGKSQHNVDFGGGAAPGVCAQTAGPSSGVVPPLPHDPTRSGWSGSCTFNTPGTYNFHCDEHPTEMRGTIVVEGATTTETTATTTPTTEPTTTTPPKTETTITPPPTTTATTPTATIASTPSSASTPSPAGTTPPSPPAATTGEAAGAAHDSLRGTAVSLAASQRGTSVHGSVRIAQGGSRLEVDLLAPSATLAGIARAKTAVVGRLVRPRTPAGRVSFQVALTTRARRALARRGRLVLIVRILMTPPHGPVLARTIAVTLHR
jgi:plastocyanin